MYGGLSVLFSGPIGYGIGFISGADKWRYFFWITGTMTCVWALIMLVVMPDNPVKAKFITEREKAIAIDRVRADQIGIENKTFKKEQVVEALMDPKTWLMFFFNIWISIPNGGLTNVRVCLWFEICADSLVLSSDHQRPRILCSEIDSADDADRSHPDGQHLYMQWRRVSLRKAPLWIPKPWRLGYVQLCNRNDCGSLPVHTTGHQSPW